MQSFPDFPMLALASVMLYMNLYHVLTGESPKQGTKSLSINHLEIFRVSAEVGL